MKLRDKMPYILIELVLAGSVLFIGVTYLSWGYIFVPVLALVVSLGLFWFAYDIYKE